MSDKKRVIVGTVKIDRRTGNVVEPESPSLPAPKTCSSLENTTRRLVWIALDNIKTLAANTEAELQKNPDGVIPWIHLQTISEESAKLLYAAGQVNACVLSRDRNQTTT